MRTSLFVLTLLFLVPSRFGGGGGAAVYAKRPGNREKLGRRALPVNLDMFQKWGVVKVIRFMGRGS